MNTAPLQRLREAASDGDFKKFKQLLEVDSTLLNRFLDATDGEATDNPLHTAALHGHLVFTSEVLSLNPQLAEKPNGEGCLPLHLAAAGGHLKVVKKLADIADQVGQTIYLSRENTHGYTPVHIAAINGKHDVVELLVQKCKEALAITTNKNETLLHLAVKANCLDSVRYFINQGVNINEKNVDGDTCLHLACQKRNQQVITELLDQKGIQVNSANLKHLTPLDVLLLSSSGYSIDVFLVNLLRRGRQEARERSNDTSNNIYNNEAKTKNDAQALLLLATLVATMTFAGFAVILSSSGVLIQPFENGDMHYYTWRRKQLFLGFIAYPAVRPALLFELQTFFLLDAVALFLSIFVILYLLICESPKKQIEMKLLAGLVGLASFIAIFVVVCVPGAGQFVTWSILFVGVLWGAIRMVKITRRGGFKRNKLNCIIFILGLLALGSSVVLLVFCFLKYIFCMFEILKVPYYLC